MNAFDFQAGGSSNTFDFQASKSSNTIYHSQRVPMFSYFPLFANQILQHNHRAHHWCQQRPWQRSPRALSRQIKPHSHCSLTCPGLKAPPFSSSRSMPRSLLTLLTLWSSSHRMASIIWTSLLPMLRASVSYKKVASLAQGFGGQGRRYAKAYRHQHLRRHLALSSHSALVKEV